MLRIGLTGGIASGKSTAAAMFAEHGVCIIDTDIIARELVAPGAPALAEIANAFGPEFVAGGVLDRRGLRRVVFADADKRRRLEAILHPPIRKAALERSAECPGPYVILVVPLLFESGFDRLVDRTLVVDCAPALQIDRLMARDGTSREEAEAIVATQMGRGERASRADDLLDSGASIDETHRRVLELHEAYLALARNCPGAQGRAE